MLVCTWLGTNRDPDTETLTYIETWISIKQAITWYYSFFLSAVHRNQNCNKFSINALGMGGKNQVKKIINEISTQKKRERKGANVCD